MRRNQYASVSHLDSVRRDYNNIHFSYFHIQ